MKKNLSLLLFFSACCAPKKLTTVSSSESIPVMICNAATEGQFKYEDHKLFVCAPAARTEKNAGEYGWQQVKWMSKAAQQQQQQQPQQPAQQPQPAAPLSPPQAEKAQK